MCPVTTVAKAWGGGGQGPLTAARQLGVKQPPAQGCSPSAQPVAPPGLARSLVMGVVSAVGKVLGRSCPRPTQGLVRPQVLPPAPCRGHSSGATDDPGHSSQS